MQTSMLLAAMAVLPARWTTPPAPVVAAPMTEASRERCRNFGGSWHGQCVDSDGVIEDADLTIEQSGCDSVAIGTAMKVGATSAASTIGSSGGMTSASRLAWNHDQTALNYVMTGVAGSHAVPFTFQIWVGLALADGKLVEKQTSQTRSVGNGVDGIGAMYSSTCTYDRVQP